MDIHRQAATVSELALDAVSFLFPSWFEEVYDVLLHFFSDTKKDFLRQQKTWKLFENLCFVVGWLWVNTQRIKLCIGFYAMRLYTLQYLSQEWLIIFVVL